VARFSPAQSVFAGSRAWHFRWPDRKKSRTSNRWASPPSKLLPIHEFRRGPYCPFTNPRQQARSCTISGATNSIAFVAPQGCLRLARRRPRPTQRIPRHGCGPSHKRRPRSHPRRGLQPQLARGTTAAGLTLSADWTTSLYYMLGPNGEYLNFFSGCGKHGQLQSSPSFGHLLLEIAALSGWPTLHVDGFAVRSCLGLWPRPKWAACWWNRPVVELIAEGRRG